MSAKSVPSPRSRQLNSRAVLALLWDAGVLTVSDLMHRTGLTRATVHAVCNELVLTEWVRQVGVDRSAPASAGRPAKRFAFNERAGYVLGADIGDTGVHAVLADLHGTTIVTGQQRSTVAATTPVQRLRQLSDLVAEILSRAQIPQNRVLAAGVGLAAPAKISGAGVSTVAAAANPFWASFQIIPTDLRTALGGIPVLIGNDANMAALGERWRGAAQGVDTFITLLSGDRLGAGVMESGRLLEGNIGALGEMQFLEEVRGVGSAHGIAALARDWALEAIRAGRPTSVGLRAGAGVRNVTTELVFAAAADGDAVAGEIMERLAERFARLIAVMSTFFDPELVVIAGAVAGSASVLLAPIAARLPELMFAPPRLACSSLGHSIVAIGAARLALDHVQGTALDQLAWVAD